MQSDDNDKFSSSASADHLSELWLEFQTHVKQNGAGAHGLLNGLVKAGMERVPQLSVPDLVKELQRHVHAAKTRTSGSDGGDPTVNATQAKQALEGDGSVDAVVPWQVLPTTLPVVEEQIVQEVVSVKEERSLSTNGKKRREGMLTLMARRRRQRRLQREKEALREAQRTLRDDNRDFAIVTTASLPWMTGTSVNPLLRAVYLSRAVKSKVTLVVPWLPICDQRALFPAQQTFETPEHQEAYVKEWVRERVGFEGNFRVHFYPGRYCKDYGSILPVGDMTQYIPKEHNDVAILEEPEHLNWFHHGPRWTKRFKHVVGVVHTNYLEYARREVGGAMKEKLLFNLNQICCRLHCHKVVKLSGAVQPLPKSETMFVHGVSPRFLEVGDSISARTGVTGTEKPSTSMASVSEAMPSPQPATPPSKFTKGAYFIGKMLWAKGYSELLDLVEQHQQTLERDGKPGMAKELARVDVFGNGEDFKNVTQTAAEKNLPLTFHGARDHAHKDIHEYKVFINPSLSDVVATTSAEALAMGKFVVCAEHPSNEFFSHFSNCLIYRTPEEFIQCVQKAMTSEPAALTPEERHSLTWEAATNRFLDVAEIKRPKSFVQDKLEGTGWALYNAATGVDVLRRLAGHSSSNSVRIVPKQQLPAWALSP